MIPKPPEPVPGPLTERLDGRCRDSAWHETREPLSAERTFPLESRAGGSCHEWIRHLHADSDESLSGASDSLRRIFRIYQGQGRTERLVVRLAGIEKSAQEELLRERAAAAELARENRFVRRMLDDRDRQFTALQMEFVSLQRNWLWRALRTVRLELGRVRRMFRQPGEAQGGRAGQTS